MQYMAYLALQVVNDVILDHIRSGIVRYVRCDTKRFTHTSVIIERHDDGKEEDIKADVAIFATGFKRPSVDFLPDDLFPKGYEVSTCSHNQEEHWPIP